MGIYSEKRRIVNRKSENKKRWKKGEGEKDEQREGTERGKEKERWSVEKNCYEGIFSAHALTLAGRSFFPSRSRVVYS